jgi:propionyl-CoA carboxylase alpha chain
MFKKILIANRGEIACRVIKTARKMGIATVAVYSDADRNALHVKMADEAVHIGPPPGSESYIVIDKIMAAIKATGAEAVHPGYGFLSENANSPRRWRRRASPSSARRQAIEAMGDKITSKKIAAEAGVSHRAGLHGPDRGCRRGVEDLRRDRLSGDDQGVAGGGGKGMRIAWNEDEVREGFQASKNEARRPSATTASSSRNSSPSRAISRSRCWPTSMATAIYLGERECSIQRRNQKVIEEAPSPFLDEATRKAMGEQAVALAKAVGYDSAGTVEFIVDKTRISTSWR